MKSKPVRPIASFFAAGLLALSVGLSLTGCFGILKPARSTERIFVLTPLPAESAKPAPGGIAIGVGQVKLPSYLQGRSLAVRQGTNEVQYLPLALWAEQLDNGLQRVVTANLVQLLPTDQVRMTSWRSEDVAAEIYFAIEEFDVDVNGRCQLVVWWRIMSPGGEKLLKYGQCRLAGQGPVPAKDVAGAVATLNDLVSQFSRQLAAAVKEAAAAPPKSAPAK